MSTSYNHTQISWFLVASAGLMVFVIVAMAVASGRFEITLIVPLVIILLTVVNFAWMTVTVSDESVTVVMGTGLLQRTVKVNGIRRYGLIRNPWYRGIGVRLYDRGSGTSLSVWGFDALELITADGNLRIGTDEPDKLLAAIKAAQE